MNRFFSRVAKYRESLTPLRALNLMMLRASFLTSHWLRRPLVWGYPAQLLVEPTNMCNLRCPLCPIGMGVMSRPYGTMTLDDFKRIVDEASPTVFYIGLWNYGEPFINQSLCSMITYAKQQRMYVVTSTNGHFLDRGDTIKDLLESGLDRLIISLDGASPETYNLYRRGGDFERVLNGMRRLIQEKHKLGRAVPTVDLQFIVMRHNEHEIPLIRNVARSIGVDTLTIKTVGVSTVDQAEEYLPRVERSRYDRELFLATRRLTVKKRKRGCWTLWNQCVIGWDGVAYPCCYDNEILNPLNDLGNVLSAGLKAVWKGQRYNAFRGQVLRDKTQIPMCANCPEP